MKLTERGANIRELVEKKLECTITDEEMAKAEKYAKRKLNWIIQREGDSQGERLKPWYLTQLIAEAIKQNRFSNACTEYYRLTNELSALVDIHMDTKKDCAAL